MWGSWGKFDYRVLFKTGNGKKGHVSPSRFSSISTVAVLERERLGNGWACFQTTEHRVYEAYFGKIFQKCRRVYHRFIHKLVNLSLALCTSAPCSKVMSSYPGMAICLFSSKTSLTMSKRLLAMTFDSESDYGRIPGVSHLLQCSYHYTTSYIMRHDAYLYLI